jgi:hypothetical protein
LPRSICCDLGLLGAGATLPGAGMPGLTYAGPAECLQIISDNEGDYSTPAGTNKSYVL